MSQISWLDLTVPNADELKDFYAAVMGWEVESLSMGEYSDYVMKDPQSGEPVAGVCHARGRNAHIPPVWLAYVKVRSIEVSLAECTARGGTIISPATSAGCYGRFAIIRDPVGAVLALSEPAD